MELFQYNINFAKAGVLELKNYLLSKELFWPIHLSSPSGQSPYPKLTIGNLVFYLKRAEACVQLSKSSAEYARVEDEIQVIATKWRSAWEEKAEKEYSSRLRQWQNFINELRKGNNPSQSNYRTEVKLRVLLQLLSEEYLVNTEAEVDVFDQVLRSKFLAGNFIWDQDYMASFPQEPYWYLYGTPS